MRKQSRYYTSCSMIGHVIQVIEFIVIIAVNKLSSWDPIGLIQLLIRKRGAKLMTLKPQFWGMCVI